MLDRSVGALVIIDGGSVPVGIITDRDLVSLIAEGVDPDEATIGCFAGQMLQTVAVVDGIRDVTEKMHKHGVRRLPVVDAAGRLAGIVSLDDILVLLGKELGDVAETIENQFAQERVMTSLRRAREG
jgi:CBS domain-containing protein